MSGRCHGMRAAIGGHAATLETVLIPSSLSWPPRDPEGAPMGLHGTRIDRVFSRRRTALVHRHAHGTPMNPTNVRRQTTARLTDLPNVGPAMARDLERIGIRRPADLAGRDPLDLYEKLCSVTRTRHDPCVLDVFMSVTHFIDGGRARPWWAFTTERKRRYGAALSGPRPAARRPRRSAATVRRRGGRSA